MPRKPVINVAILGSGNIATDLLFKVKRSEFLECTAFLGRTKNSNGLARARDMGIPVSADGIGYLQRNPDCADIVFDATSAAAHEEHAPILEKMGKFSLDLTPAHVGKKCVPAVNKAECVTEANINMISCGGQASIPVAYCIGQTHPHVEYIEVISSIASKSAGAATRINLDEYIHTTEQGVQEFSKAETTKAILNLNPAYPCIKMQTTILAKVENPNIEGLRSELNTIVQVIQQYVPGYQIILGPTLENGRLVVMVRVSGRGDFLPSYAGNLDIITCAAVEMAEEYAKYSRQSTLVTQKLGVASHETHPN